MIKTQKPSSFPPLCLNLVTGEWRDIKSVDDADLLQSYEIPCCQMAKSSCKKCYGRGYWAYSDMNQSHVVCPKCVKRMVDREWMVHQWQQQMAAQQQKKSAEAGPTADDLLI